MLFGKKKNPWQDGFRSGFIAGQDSALTLSEPFAKLLMENARFDMQRQIWEIPQESYHLAKLALMRESEERLKETPNAD